jgi:hypothetical protein
LAEHGRGRTEYVAGASGPFQHPGSVAGHGHHKKATTPGRILPGVAACGGDVPISVDVRIVAAANKDQQSRVRDELSLLELEKKVIGNARGSRTGT